MGDNMFKKYFFSGAVAMGLLFSSLAQADIISYPGDELKKPIRLCKESPNPELSEEALFLLGQAAQNVECGQYQKALNKLYNAIEIVEHLQQQTQTPLGYCYYKRNCRGKIATQKKVQKKQCKGIFGGKSWRRVNPTPAACVNI